MEANVKSVYFSIGGEPTELVTDKTEVVPYDKYLFDLHRKVHFDVEMGYEPEDGFYHSLQFHVLIDGAEVDMVTDILPRELDNRTGHYYADIPKYAKYSKAGKLHTIQIVTKYRKYVKNGINTTHEEEFKEISKSEVYYYKVKPAND